jgi:hypothetical protein
MRSARKKPDQRIIVTLSIVSFAVAFECMLYSAADILGPLIITRLVREQSEQYYLTDLGTELSMRPLS